MITHADIIDALTKSAAYDASHTPKTANILIAAWQEHFDRYAPNITRDDLLNAATEYHREPHDRMLQPADLSSIARAIRRDQLDRSDLNSPQRLALENRADAKTTEAPRPKLNPSQHWQRLDRVIAAFNPTDTDDAAALKYLTPLTDSPLRSDCPWCNVSAGQPCQVPNTSVPLTRSRAHPARIEATQRLTTPDNPQKPAHEPHSPSNRYPSDH